MEIQPVGVQEGEGVADTAVAAAAASSGSATTMTSGTDKVTPGGELGKDEFLKLLVTQLQNQDPLNPLDNAEMIAQLAQFSALEQMNNLNESIDAMKSAQNMMDALLLQGKNVSIELKDGTTVEGSIEKVLWSDGVMKLQVNGTLYSTDSIASIALSEAEEAEGAGTTQTGEYE